MSEKESLKRGGTPRRRFAAASDKGNAININTGDTNCDNCGHHCHHCCCPPPPPPPKAWVIILKFCFKLTIIVSVLIVFAGSGYYYFNKGCDKCFQKGWEKGYKIGVQAGKDPFSVRERGALQTSEGGPCRRWSEGRCIEARTTHEAMRWARYYLYRGDSEIALVGMSQAPGEEEYIRVRREEARNYYRSAITIGSGVGAQAAIYAAKRIQYQSMACAYDQESLDRISRNWEKNSLGDLIEMKQKQGALDALGYYSGEIDNNHSPEVRTAIRGFQSDLGFDQTGVLTAEQTTLLICAGAQIAKGLSSQNVLGIMFATGLGVRQNTDSALNWLETAAQRGDADAYWNLAMMYGTQTVLSSILVCDAVQNAERADSYLLEAVRRDHPVAIAVSEKYHDDDPATRWRKISGDLNMPEALNRVGRGCNP